MNGYLKIKTTIDNSGVDKQVKQLETKLNDLKSALKMAEEDKTLFSDSEILDMEVEVEKLTNKIKNLKNVEEDYSENSDKNFKKTTSSLKRFAYSLLTVGSIYGLLSKASSSYLSQNQELANKFQSFWVGLGTFLAPLMEFLADMLLKILGYLNVFIEALTGVNFIANANAKAIKNQANAQKELNRQTASFDEMNIQASQTSVGGVSGGTSGTIQIPELDEGIVKGLQNMAYWLKENWTWIEVVGASLLALFAGWKLVKILSGIGSLLGTGALGGLVTLLTALTAIFTITIAIKGVANAYQQLQELNKQLDYNNQLTAKNRDEAEKATDEWMERYKAGLLNEEQTRAHTQGIQDQIYWLNNHVESLEDEKDMFGALIGKNAQLSEEQRTLIEEMQILIQHEGELYNQGLLNEQQTVEYAKHLEQQIKIQEALGGETADLKRKYQELTNTTYYIRAKATLDDEITAKWNNIIANINKGVSSNLSLIFGKSVNAASGGIVNNPGKGVSLGSTIKTGENGREGILPLSDPRTMSQLGEEIGKWITINNVTNTYLDNRLIQKSQSKYQNELSFSTNGRM